MIQTSPYLKNPSKSLFKTSFLIYLVFTLTFLKNTSEAPLNNSQPYSLVQFSIITQIFSQSFLSKTNYSLSYLLFDRSFFINNFLLTSITITLLLLTFHSITYTNSYSFNTTLYL